MSPPPPGPLSDIVEAGGLGLQVIDLDDGGVAPIVSMGVVRLGVSRAATAPAVDKERFDVLLSADPAAAAPWVGLPAGRLEAAAQVIQAMVEAQPVAAAVACQGLRASLKLSFDEALAQESLAYSMLLASEGFRAWRAAHPPRGRPRDVAPRVATQRRDDGRLSIRLTRAAARNAVDARMRDALAEALAFALDDPDAAPVVLSGEGPSFCAGGDLDEFGSAADPGQAHAIRLLRSATALAHRLGPRLTVRAQGACIGAGIEIPAAAGRIVATADAAFRLPEVGMGLIPGAGGTASIPRRIGRHRTAFMALTGWDIDAGTARTWGLVDAVEGLA
ncbi:enoyl-CoA hydratase/isomerase family protein [Caulobacter sp. KR2-114]|uniref:enoyl-CoA hydratase/isomerase family protein n=1 Tax=Caulobacter sp. KR2-114 TaxID=3400912 RepID=UPI003C0B1846